MAKKKPKKAKMRVKKTSPLVALQQATIALANARHQWGKAVFAAQTQRPGGGCGGTCDGYGFGLGFDWVKGSCEPCAAHVFSAAAQQQAKDDLMASANASCAIPGGSDCKCKGGRIIEHKRTCERVEILTGENEGIWCQYTLWVKMDGGTCQ